MTLSVLVAVLIAGFGACDVLQFDPSLPFVVDPSAKMTIISQQNFSVAHGGGIYMPETDDFYMATSFLKDPVTGGKSIKTYKINMGTKVVSEVQPKPLIPMVSGASFHSGHEILFCTQGLGLNTTVGGLVMFDIRTSIATPLNVDPPFNFNSPNDVFVSSKHDGYFFTDPWYGATIGYRAPATLNQSVYFVERKTLKVYPIVTLAAASRPNGVVVSTDGKTLYVADSGFRPGVGRNPNVTRSIYAYDLGKDNNGIVHASNQRFFVENVDNGIPDTLRFDELGNLYAAVQDGVAIYSPAGVYMGKLQIPTAGPVNSFGFANRTLVLLVDPYIYGIELKVGSAPTGIHPPTAAFRVHDHSWRSVHWLSRISKDISGPLSELSASWVLN